MRFGSFLVASALLTSSADPTGEPKFLHPLIQNYGGVVALPEAAEQPRADSQMLLDLTSDELKGGVMKGLDRAAMLANLYHLADAGTEHGMKLAVIVHGPATKAVLTDEAYAQHVKDAAAKNPNRELIAQLRAAGVEIYVCGQALARNTYATSDVLDDVTVSVSAAIVHVNKQRDGYVLVP